MMKNMIKNFKNFKNLMLMLMLCGLMCFSVVSCNTSTEDEDQFNNTDGDTESVPGETDNNEDEFKYGGGSGDGNPAAVKVGFSPIYEVNSNANSVEWQSMVFKVSEIFMPDSQTCNADNGVVLVSQRRYITTDILSPVFTNDNYALKAKIPSEQTYCGMDFRMPEGSNLEIRGETTDEISLQISLDLNSMLAFSVRNNNFNWQDGEHVQYIAAIDINQLLSASEINSLDVGSNGICKISSESNSRMAEILAWRIVDGFVLYKDLNNNSKLDENEITTDNIVAYGDTNRNGLTHPSNIDGDEDSTDDPNVDGDISSELDPNNIGYVLLVRPHNDEIVPSTPIEFTWLDNPNAARYQLTVSTNQDLSSPLIQKSDITTTNYTTSTEFPLTTGTIYCWAVMPIDAEGEYGTLSETNCFYLITKSPSGSVVINNNEATTVFTDVVLNLTTTGIEDQTFVYISEDGTLPDTLADVQRFSETIEYSFDSYKDVENAELTIYVWFMDKYSHMSERYSDSIQLSRTLVSGQINENTTWTLSNSPYCLNDDIQIETDITLDVESGVEIYCQNNIILSLGTFMANGTSENKISLNNCYIMPWNGVVNISFANITGTSLRNNNSNFRSGTWILRDSLIMNSGDMYVYVPTENCYIERNVFVDSGEIRLWEGETHTITIKNNAFINYEKDRQYFIRTINNSLSSSFDVHLNSFYIYNNRQAVMSGGSIDTFDLSNNYWNTSDTSVIDSMILDHSDDMTIAPTVNYSPILTEPHVDTPDVTEYIE